VTIARGAVLFFVYTLFALALTAPIAWHLGRVPHDIGDPLLSTVLLWWNAHHLPLTSEWWNGSFFVPAGGALSFSDHRLGESLLASPLQWAGVTPLAAANLTLLATFPLCALAAHWLAYTVTGRHDASLIAGVAYGFSPYRFAHIEHLELLAAFGMPVALGALHCYLGDRQRKWIVLFGAALFIQALACSYYFLFFLVLLGLWVLWFVRRDAVSFVFAIAVSVGLTSVAISPIALRYLSIHEHYGMVRILPEILTLSADVTSIVTAPPTSLLWGWTGTLNGPERQLFPGSLVVVLIVAALIAALRARPGGSPSRSRWPLMLAATALAFAGIAMFAAMYGPSHIGPISITVPYKPFSLAFYAAVGALLTTGWVRGAFERRSLLAFYVLAAATMFVFALGPAPAFLHRQILYEPPYAWLMRLGLFREGVRVPARFGMLVVLALSVAAAIAFQRLFSERGSRSIGAAIALALAILLDSAIRPVPMLAPPAPWPAPVPTDGVAATLELPLGETIHDVAAMYRSVLTGVPTVNGYSGYFPPHYETLRLALDEWDESALDYLAGGGPLVVAVERGWPYARERLEWLRSLKAEAPQRPTAAEVAASDEHVWFLVRGSGLPPKLACGTRELPILSARDWRGQVDLAPLRDQRDDTFWSSGGSQRAGDALVVDLGSVARACSVRLTLGSHSGSYPRALSVATSTDGDRWDNISDGRLGGAAVRAAIDRPRQAMIELPLHDHAARFIRLQMTANQPRIAWLLTEIAVTASPAE
jgi:hypothetical protein